MNKKEWVKSLAITIATVLAFSIVFSGCQTAKVTKTGEPVELTWYYMGASGDDSVDAQEVFAAANELTKKELGITVKYLPISAGEYTQKMQLKASAAEEFDLCLTGTNYFPFFDNSKKGAFLPLDELLEKYGKKTKELIPEKIWKATKIGGKILAVPNYQASFSKTALVFQKSLVDKYNLKDQIDKVQTVQDLTPILEVIKKNEPNIVPTALGTKTNLDKIEGYYEKPLADIPIGVDKDLNVVDLTKGEYRQKELELEKLSREWYLKGFFHPDAGLKYDVEGQIKERRFFLVGATALPGAEADLEKRYGYPVYIAKPGDSILSASSIAATMTAISRTSKNPEKAMQFIEMVNSNQELYNLLCFGIQDKHYKKTGENSIEIVENAGYTAYPWAMGCQFNAYRLPGQDENVWEESKRLNEEAYPAPLLGCYIDIGNIKTEISNIKTAYQPYKSVFNGQSEGYERVHKQLDEQTAKDLEIILKEITRQVEEFKNTK